MTAMGFFGNSAGGNGKKSKTPVIVLGAAEAEQTLALGERTIDKAVWKNDRITVTVFGKDPSVKKDKIVKFGTIGYVYHEVFMNDSMSLQNGGLLTYSVVKRVGTQRHAGSLVKIMQNAAESFDEKLAWKMTAGIDSGRLEMNAQDDVKTAKMVLEFGNDLQFRIEYEHKLEGPADFPGNPGKDLKKLLDVPREVAYGLAVKVSYLFYSAY
ncbi:MAG: hypothetical protein ABI361_09275 [Nitrososphaera sp.]|jgi:hypothetical protein